MKTVSTLAEWIKAYKKAGNMAFPGKGNTKESEAELIKLRKELAIAREERDILKKALGIFSSTKISIFEYIEVFYNRQRIHSTLGYVTPEEFETKGLCPLNPEIFNEDVAKLKEEQISALPGRRSPTLLENMGT